VPGGNGAVTSREAAVEVLALNVFGLADAAGQLITRRMVESRLAELAGHPPGCGCGLCELLPLVTCSKVWWCASRLAGIDQPDPATGTALEQKFFALAPKMLPHCGIEVVNPTFNGPAGASAKGAIETHHDCTV
jgi:hypothetical protein